MIVEFSWSLVTAILAIIGVVWSIAYWVSKVNSDRSSFKEFMNKVSGQLEKISADILSLKVQLKGKTIESKSPYNLSKLGVEVSDEISGKKIAEKLSVKFIDKAKKLDTKYEIQDLCFRFAHGEYEPENQDLRIMQECAYNKGITIKEVKDVIAIELRDILIARTQKD